MKLLLRLVAIASAMVSAGLVSESAHGQATMVPPNSQPAVITRTPLSTSVPISFDQFINPVSGEMSSMATTLAAAHQKARESTLLGLYYLRANQKTITAGSDTIYNEVFGTYYDQQTPAYKQGIYIIDNTHYFQVHNTYATIRSLLDQPTTFSGGAHINPASLTAVDTTSIFGATRGWRQWGYSNTGNPGTSVPTLSPLNDTRLRWIDDNDAAFGRKFFNEKLDIYGAPNNPSQQFVGNVFFTQLERPSDLYGRGTPPPAGTLTKTELNREQMIIASFSEFTTSFVNPNVPVGPPVVVTRGGAFFGLHDIELFTPGDESFNFYSAYEARNFGRFIKRLAEIGLDDVRKAPPLNKNVQFRPFVPTPAAGTGS